VETLTARYHLSEIELTLGTSVGYALCPDHAQTGKHILSFADTAMYHAKRNKQNVARYQSDMTDRLTGKLFRRRASSPFLKIQDESSR